jgi:hypothetical protein
MRALRWFVIGCAVIWAHAAAGAPADLIEAHEADIFTVPTYAAGANAALLAGVQAGQARWVAEHCLDVELDAKAFNALVKLVKRRGVYADFKRGLEGAAYSCTQDLVSAGNWSKLLIAPAPWAKGSPQPSPSGWLALYEFPGDVGAYVGAAAAASSHCKAVSYHREWVDNVIRRLAQISTQKLKVFQDGIDKGRKEHDADVLPEGHCQTLEHLVRDTRLEGLLSTAQQPDAKP